MQVGTYESEAADVTVSFVSNSATAAELDVTGSVTGKAYDTEAYGDTIAEAAQISLQIPVESDSTQYNVVTTNPAYERYFSTDPRIEGNTKTQTVSGEELAQGLLVILTSEDQATPITAKINKINGDFEKTYTINNKLSFATSAAAKAKTSTRNKLVSVTEDDGI